MKTLTIRLNDEDLERLKAFQSEHHVSLTINGAIRSALKLAIEYIDLHNQLAALFTPAWEVNQKKLKELNNKYGLLQKNLFD